MSLSNLFNIGRSYVRPDWAPSTEYLVARRPLSRVLAFTRRSIDDVVNDPIAKREVLGYYKLYRQVQRSAEISDLERQWNI